MIKGYKRRNINDHYYNIITIHLRQLTYCAPKKISIVRTTDGKMTLFNYRHT
uniref:Uncharacterized protein n=1 Tax=Rhizophagus irregularis (strain DAOM 181602 / DAOM 197198 / MUCL 43194) TaxID=747089 RepID=U9TE01_RHIID